VSLTPSMFVMLQQIAKFQEVPVSTIVREAVESYLAKG
jgi:Ribbon-helix-helix domain